MSQNFYLLEIDPSRAENTLHIFATADARVAKTKELIYGAAELSPVDARVLDLYLTELRLTGSLAIEADQRIEWFRARPA